MAASLVVEDWRFQLNLTILSGVLTLFGVYLGARLAFSHQARLRRDERETEAFARLADSVYRLAQGPSALQVNGIASLDVVQRTMSQQDGPTTGDLKSLSNPDLREGIYVAFSLVRHIDLAVDEDNGKEWITANWDQLADLTGYCRSLANALFELAAGRRADLPAPIHTGSANDYFVQVD